MKSQSLVYGRLILVEGKDDRGKGDNWGDNDWRDRNSAEIAEGIKIDIIAHKNKKTEVIKIPLLINSYLNIAFFITTDNI